MADREVKAAILSFLEKKGRWGASYFPLDTLVRWLGREVKRGGKRVRNCVDDLAKEEYILFLKKGKTVSLNPFKKKEIIEYVRAVSKA